MYFTGFISIIIIQSSCIGTDIGTDCSCKIQLSQKVGVFRQFLGLKKEKDMSENFAMSKEWLQYDVHIRTTPGIVAGLYIKLFY